MNNMINISFMTEDAINTLKANSKTANNYIRNWKDSSEWLNAIYSGNLFEEKKYKIPDFELKVSNSGNYDEVDFENSVILYNSLKELPLYILTDERFWAWINLTKGYKAAIQAMPVKSDSTFADHWLFSHGNRRGLFFGVLSRCFFRVYLTINETLDDKFELTKFIIDNPERFRNLTWRSSSSQKHIVQGIIKAEKEIVDKYGDLVKNSIYSDVAKYVSLYCSVRLVDVISENDIHDVVYKYMENQLLNKKINQN